MKTFYLSHHFGTRHLIRPWELEIERKYKIDLDNPFYDNEQRSEILLLDKMKDGSKEQREFFKRRDTTKLVNGDLEKIRKSDGVVAYVYEASIGTSMEILYAARILQIPVYVITKKYAYHPWIKKYATKIFSTLREFEDFARKEFGVMA